MSRAPIIKISARRVRRPPRITAASVGAPGAVRNTRAQLRRGIVADQFALDFNMRASILPGHLYDLSAGRSWVVAAY